MHLPILRETTRLPHLPAIPIPITAVVPLDKDCIRHLLILLSPSLPPSVPRTTAPRPAARRGRPAGRPRGPAWLPPRALLPLPAGALGLVRDRLPQQPRPRHRTRFHQAIIFLRTPLHRARLAPTRTLPYPLAAHSQQQRLVPRPLRRRRPRRVLMPPRQHLLDRARKTKRPRRPRRWGHRRPTPSLRPPLLPSPQRCLGHHLADQVVRQYVHPQFPLHQLRCRTPQLIHP
jgi:hypothetical protein